MAVKKLDNQSLTKITDDIYQVQLPLPFALKIVNCYLLRGESGWTIIDGGLRRTESELVWQAAFDDLGIRPGDIEQIILTHTHPDHYGGAGWLQAWSGNEPPIRLSALEAEIAQVIWFDDIDHVRMREHFFQCGLPPKILDITVGLVGKMRPMTKPAPTKQTIIEPGSILRMGDRQFEAIHTPGHSDGHLMFFDRADNLLLSGDHVLMQITPNIGIWPMTEYNPLGAYIASLNALVDLPVRLALPGHRALITDWRGRLEELQSHHVSRLDHLMNGVGVDGLTIYEGAVYLFDMNRLSDHEIRFAVAETFAHLVTLTDTGRLNRVIKDGVWRYTLA